MWCYHFKDILYVKLKYLTFQWQKKSVKSGLCLRLLLNPNFISNLSAGWPFCMGLIYVPSSVLVSHGLHDSHSLGMICPWLILSKSEEPCYATSLYLKFQRLPSAYFIKRAKRNPMTICFSGVLSSVLPRLDDF